MAKKSMQGKFDEEPYYPMVGFYFGVSFDGIKGKVDSKFMEVKGITMELDMSETLKEGGQNAFLYKLPGRTKYNDLELKRGVLSKQSVLSDWCREVIQSDYSKKITLRDLYISLYNEKKQTVMTWQFYNCFPTKVQISDLNSTNTGTSAILVESITLSFTYYDVIKS